ncbi:ribosomal protection-like ABC-F family protein [Desertivirga xinjiangensis]|uniref:ribosomal protection-like ABC-F family protein n=1 Tax=Desertivirga xinjiangensis TaxID=539206 RepID=UPI002109A6A7|nr:ABC-F family ATP-binding cassette domain-containing protein [Pedobacter xinjiangensis]
MLIIQNLTYIHPNKDLLFENINLNIIKNHKVALIGNNGAGKSTLLKILAGELKPSAGSVYTADDPYYIPQIFGQFKDLTIAEALRVDGKLRAMNEILNGDVNEENLAILNDDWTIEERCWTAMSQWNLEGFDLRQKMGTLSGGQKTKVFLAGILIHRPTIVLLDEPSNHLDSWGRKLLYEFIRSTSSTLVVVSHDRKLLNLLDEVYELNKKGITRYGGNFDFYHEQKQLESNALNHDLKAKEKALRKAKDIAREALERQQKLDARGKKKQEKAGLPTIVMNTLRNNAEKSTAKMKGIHSEKVGAISQDLSELRKDLPETDKMKFNFDRSALHTGKVLITATDVNFGYGSTMLWPEPLTFRISSGERIALKGLNGSGKTSLIQLILGKAEPLSGKIQRANIESVYIDQDYSLIENEVKVYEQAQKYNIFALQEHDVKTRLNRFLFNNEYWDKPCITLSGGEKMRLMLCCLNIRNQAPDLIVLDEPTNNLDIQNMEILTAAINDYQGTILVVSHDEAFLEQVNVERVIML